MKKTVLIALLLFVFSNTNAQNQLWKKIGKSEINTAVLERDSHPKEYDLYALNTSQLKELLKKAPSSRSNTLSNVIIPFPTTDGKIARFRIYEATVLHPDLAKKHPEIQSYIGKGIDDKTAIIGFSTTIFGLHVMGSAGDKGTSYIDPFSKDLNYYMVYRKAALQTNKTFECGVTENRNIVESESNEEFSQQRTNNSSFKTYRMAMACTVEYAAFHVARAGLTTATLAEKKAAVLAAMVVTITRLNTVYERDLAVHLVLVPNNEDLIFITTDAFTNDTAASLINESQTVIDAAIGNANYDIGHTVSTGGGGLAQSPCICSSGNKARGITGSSSPVGDPYDIDYVAHEVGHQFGGSHTFNGDSGNCGGGNRSATSAYEPGSGSTIMAYAGICSPQDVQLNSDAYFHARSIIQIQANTNSASSCAVKMANGNSPPVVNAGLNYTIPFGTAFVLKGAATDAEGDALTYCWEQYNNQTTAVQPPVETNTVGPNFRSFNPSVSPDRYFPKLSTVLTNNLATTWEVIPNVARTMNFSLVVRDNSVPNGGETQRGTMVLTVANAGPFKVTSQAATEAWAAGTTKTITWNVAGTDSTPVSAATVTIRLSTDGGLTFPVILAANTPNDGLENITVPELLASTCRIMIEADNNVFFAVNTTPFLIGYSISTVCTAYSYTTPFNLPNGGTSYTVKTINVPTTGTISDVNITIHATHTNLQNLVMAVLRPGGTLATYFNQECAGNANMNVTFDSQGSIFTCANPTTGVYAPTNLNLNTFNGFNQFGNWQFGFKDVVSGPDSGTIDSISLEVCSLIIAPLATSDFKFTNFALYPNPNTGSFTVQFNTQEPATIAVAVYDMSGRKIFDKIVANAVLFSEKIELENAQSGIYLVSISDGENKMVKQLVIQ